MNEVMTHRGARLMTRTELATIHTPIGTSSHKPVAHAELVDILTSRLAERGLPAVREQFAVSANDQQIFGALNFENGIQMPGLGRALGFHAANDKSLAIHIVAGVSVFVCDNLSLSGSAVVMKRKHTRALSLASEINLALDRFETSRRVFETSIERLQERAISDDRAKVAIFDMVYTGVLGQSLFDEVAQNYFKAEERRLEDSRPRTAWGLHNAATRAVKALSPASQYRTTYALGRYFGLGSESGLVDAEEVIVH